MSPDNHGLDDLNYTIIIPHYKSPLLLKRCLESIPNRTDIQIIVVDDNSGISYEEFPYIDRSNIKYIFLDASQSNYAGRARNVGLDYALGKWLLFADADDYFTSSGFELCDEYLDSSFDIIYFGVDARDTEGNKSQEYKQIYNELVLSCNNRSQSSIDSLRFNHDVPWGKMIKRDLVVKHNIKFGETRYNNDTLFSVLTALCACSILADNRHLYVVTATDGSLSVQHSIESQFIRYEVQLKKNKLLKDHGYGKYQSYIVVYMFFFFRKGFRHFLRAIRLGVKYKSNFFTGTMALVRSFIRKKFTNQ